MDYVQFRQNVQDMFARELDVTFVPGLLEGPNQTPDWLGSCYLRRVQEDAMRVNEQQIFLVVRVFAPFTGQGTLQPTAPADPQPLEEMAMKIQAAISRNQTGLGAWFQRVQAIDIDPETMGVQASVFAYSSNDGTVFPQ
jgi:hypothetical protein